MNATAIESDLFGVGDIALASILREDGSYSESGITLDLSQLKAILKQIRAGGLGVGGTFRTECFDPEGVRRWVDDAKNAVTLVGLDSILSIYFNAGTPFATFYIGLIDAAGYVTLSSSDTLASHSSNWAENTQYSGNRPAWGNGGSSGQSVTNASPVSFAMTPTVGSPATIKGLFLCTVASGSASPNILFSTALFSQGNQVVNNGDTLKVTYVVGATST